MIKSTNESIGIPSPKETNLLLDQIINHIGNLLMNKIDTEVYNKSIDFSSKDLPGYITFHEFKFVPDCT
jgi:hypothetical protein